MYEASERVVKTITRKNWKISDGYINRNVTMIVTPKVVVRNFKNLFKYKCFSFIYSNFGSSGLQKYEDKNFPH